MHGLIFKSVERFVIVRHGPDRWKAICRDAGLPIEQFETMHLYEDDRIEALMAAAAARLDRRPLDLIEDIAHFVCTHPPLEAVRRLIRFSGPDFEALIHALDEIGDRARMAVPDLELPAVTVEERERDAWLIRTEWTLPGASAMLTGLLRAMSDDYGCLAVIEGAGFAQEGPIWREAISVRLIAEGHHPARRFELGRAIAAR